MSNQPLPLDTDYSISSQDASLFRRISGIQDDEELKRHLLEVQSEAYAVYPYTCIRRLDFARFRIVKHPAYEYVLKLGRERKNAILLDLPCCMGCDSRIIIADGYPSENVIAADLHGDFWTMGHKLFFTTPETYRVRFLQGDIFDPNFLKPGVPALRTRTEMIEPTPSLGSLTCLTPLQHHISVIYVALFFHLFDKDDQHRLAHLFASLLSPVPGSIIFGLHVGASDSEEHKFGTLRRTLLGGTVFAHSPTSWRELWIGKDGPFKPEEVSLETEITSHVENDTAGKCGIEGSYLGHFHEWSITRV